MVAEITPPPSPSLALRFPLSELLEEAESTLPPVHSVCHASARRCDGCGRAPITGTRWQLDHEDYCESCKSTLPADTQQHMVPNQGPIKVPFPEYPPVDDTLAPRRLLVIDSPEVRPRCSAVHWV